MHWICLPETERLYFQHKLTRYPVWLVIGRFYPPWTNEQAPTDVSPGSLIRDDFYIVKHTSEFEIVASLRWTGLSRQEVANLRNLTSSKELEDLLRPYDYGISSGIEVDISSDKDPRDAEFGLMISAEQEMPQIVINKIVDFVYHYRVH